MKHWKITERQFGVIQLAAKLKISYYEIMKKVRKPMPRPSQIHSTKKGKKGYNRRIEKRIRWEEVIEHLNAKGIL